MQRFLSRFIEFRRMFGGLKSKEDLPCLAEALQVPRHFRSVQGTVCNVLAGLCILLKQLPYACRYYDIIYRFERPVPVVCMLHNVVLELVF